MADSSSTTRRVLARALGALVVLVLAATLAPVAGAEPTTEEKLERAEAEAERLGREIQEQQRVLNRLLAESARVNEELQQAQSRWHEITDQLATTRRELTGAQEESLRLQEQLNTRVRETFISGPGTELEFLLGASSIADLSARVEYMSALNETDADLATAVLNLRNDLAEQKEEEEDLQARAAEALREIQRQEAALDAQAAEADAILADLEQKQARVEELAERLDRQLQRELQALFGLGAAAKGIFKYCPVDEPRAVYDGFGAPRYGGGYHPHAGNDIIAPMATEIRATFDGYAHTSTNSLGGYAVYVDGEYGYTYNAHLMAPGVTGQVQAGQVIGYVGTTGNASTPHNHFEWHPYTTPSDWPVSPYGYSVIGSAVNPWPILSQVC